MNEYKIIYASESDIRLIQSMADVAFRHTYQEILSPDQMEYMMEWMYSADSLKKQIQSGHVFFIAYQDDKACGYMSVQPDGTDDDGVLLFHLHKLYVLPSEQGCGLGRMLFDMAIEFAVKASAGHKARIELNVNRTNPAVAFYKHLGLGILRQGDFHIGNGYYMNDYIMGYCID